MTDFLSGLFTGPNMPPAGYLIGLCAIIFAITFCLRAVPFAILQPLRESRFVIVMAVWMPAGILLVLALSILSSTITADPAGWWMAIVAAIVTIVSHLALGRRTIVSIALGTLVYVLLVNLF